ncbi:hypothetical protein AEM42_03765 [Betaproteobacteria bacterium UKL13-2]|nr:hypothetical protein AEM42_03765 [Betaproteobacteria bacterium UKL13-2]HCG51989.1 hypothetical protein [Betaproteobacteria bacterium]
MGYGPHSLVEICAKLTILTKIGANDYNGRFSAELYMQNPVRTISSSDAKATLGDVLSSLDSQGPVEITRNGKTVGLLTLPPLPPVDANRLASLAIAYSKGLISWPQIAEETGASYGELLIALGLKNLSIPIIAPKKRPEQLAFFHQILDKAAARQQKQ